MKTATLVWVLLQPLSSWFGLGATFSYDYLSAKSGSVVFDMHLTALWLSLMFST